MKTIRTKKNQNQKQKVRKHKRYTAEKKVKVEPVRDIDFNGIEATLGNSSFKNAGNYGN